MKIAIFATPEYIVPIIDLLSRNLRKNNESPIACVITQKPKPMGRKKLLAYSAVDDWAHKRNVPKFYNSQDFLESAIDCDLGVLASYGEIIPKEVINKFTKGILNIHPSLLPKYRGASPIQSAIASGEKDTGVTIIKLDEKLDHGPIVAQFKEPILNTDTSLTLRTRLFERSAEVILELIPAYMEGKITPRVQDESKATFTRQLTKEDGFIPPKYIDSLLTGKALKSKWEIGFIKDYSITPDASVLDCFIRAMQPWPQAWTYINTDSRIKDKKTRMKILKAHIEDETSKPKLVLDEVQLAGKNPVNWSQFIQAYQDFRF